MKHHSIGNFDATSVNTHVYGTAWQKKLQTKTLPEGSQIFSIVCISHIPIR